MVTRQEVLQTFLWTKLEPQHEQSELSSEIERMGFFFFVGKGRPWHFSRTAGESRKQTGSLQEQRMMRGLENVISAGR